MLSDQVYQLVMDMGDAAIRRLQQLDDTGYSGHLSYILHMLDAPAFLTTYMAGECRPEEVVDFGKSHGIAINRMVVELDRFHKKITGRTHGHAP